MSEELTLPTRAAIATNEAPKAIGPYSQGIRAGNLLFTSGQIALDPETQQVVPGTIAEQARQVFSNLKAVLEAGGSDFAALNAVYAEHLALPGVPPPARTTVEVSRLPKDVLVEIDLIALIPVD